MRGQRTFSAAWRRRIAAAALWLAALLAPAAPLPAQTGAPLEYAVKATYLYKFVPFVTWPAGTFSAPSSPYHLCVVGNDAFAGLLERVVEGEVVSGRRFVVQRLSGFDPGFPCHIMYVMGTERRAAADVLRAVGDRPILTFTDQAAGGEARGIVHFVVHNDRVRFEIDNKVALARGLQISAKVLELALSVNRG